MNTPKSQIVKNASRTNNYKYSNLADLARAGIEIPPMKVQKVDDDEYIFAKVGDEWIQGARIIPIESKMMNPAQAYGAALTYARRYTVQLIQAVACDDDDAIEQDKHITKPATQLKDTTTNFDAIQEAVNAIDDVESLNDYYKSLEVSKKLPATQNRINSIVKKRKLEIEAQAQAVAEGTH